MNFKEGQRVVCIDDSIPYGEVFRDFSYWIKKDQIYTVRRCYYMSILNTYAVLLKEIKNPSIDNDLLGKVEPAYRADRFRPIDENELELKETKQLEEVL